MSKAQLTIDGFFDPATSTVSYLVLDPASRGCALIDRRARLRCQIWQHRYPFG